jgi:signal transduction histidine kinase
MSQEFRNPLNSMIWSIDLMKSQGMASLWPNMKHHLESFEHWGQILLHLINNILDASTLQTQKLDLGVTECDVRALIVRQINV